MSATSMQPLFFCIGADFLIHASARDLRRLKLHYKYFQDTPRFWAVNASHPRIAGFDSRINTSRILSLKVAMLLRLRDLLSWHLYFQIIRTTARLHFSTPSQRGIQCLLSAHTFLGYRVPLFHPGHFHPIAITISSCNPPFPRCQGFKFPTAPTTPATPTASLQHHKFS